MMMDTFPPLHRSVYYVLGTWGYSGERGRPRPCTVGVEVINLKDDDADG